MLLAGVRMAEPSSWTCPTCSKQRRLRFCPQCGEERRRRDDLSMHQLTRQLVAAASSVDGKLMRSWRMLMMRPGSLTAAHISGERRRYITPLALFFIGNALF